MLVRGRAKKKIWMTTERFELSSHSICKLASFSEFHFKGGESNDTRHKIVGEMPKEKRLRHVEMPQFGRLHSRNDAADFKGGCILPY